MGARCMEFLESLVFKEPIRIIFFFFFVLVYDKFCSVRGLPFLILLKLLTNLLSVTWKLKQNSIDHRMIATKDRFFFFFWLYTCKFPSIRLLMLNLWHQNFTYLYWLSTKKTEIYTVSESTAFPKCAKNPNIVPFFCQYFQTDSCCKHCTWTTLQCECFTIYRTEFYTVFGRNKQQDGVLPKTSRRWKNKKKGRKLYRESLWPGTKTDDLSKGVQCMHAPSSYMEYIKLLYYLHCTCTDFQSAKTGQEVMDRRSGFVMNIHVCFMACHLYNACCEVFQV